MTTTLLARATCCPRCHGRLLEMERGEIGCLMCGWLVGGALVPAGGMPPSSATRRCRVCGVEKAVGEFRDTGSRHGVRHICRTCQQQAEGEYRRRAKA